MTKPPREPHRIGAREVLDLYFLEHRAKLIDVAAFLDRIERAAVGAPCDDFRLAQFREALALLDDGRGERARRVLELLSDPTREPLESAEGLKGAAGAWSGASKRGGGA